MADTTFNTSWISGMPRSGTTWLSQIFASSPDVRLKFCPLFSYEFKNCLNENSTLNEWEKLFSEVYQTNSEYLDQDYLRKEGLVTNFPTKYENPSHLIIKSTRFHNLMPHLLKQNTSIRVIYLVRHPCASIYSWLTNPYEFPSHADPAEEWKTGSCRKNDPGEFWGFDDWKKVTLQALDLAQLYPSQFKIQRYEDLVLDTPKYTKELFSYLGIPYKKQTEEFIALTRSKHDSNKRSIFKKIELQDNWRILLDPTIINTCYNELKNTSLEKFLMDDGQYNDKRK